jgi:hypothetical protein
LIFSSVEIAAGQPLFIQSDRHPEGCERARAFISGQVALKDLLSSQFEQLKTKGLSPLLRRRRMRRRKRGSR